MKRILLILIVFITGCSYTDLKDLTIIKSIGIEYSDNYIIYAQIYDEIKKENHLKTKLIESKGKTINEAFDNLKEIINKDILLSHIDILVLSSNLNSSNYSEIIDYFLNNNEIRNDFLTISSDTLNTILDNSKYNDIENFIKNNNSHYIINISFEELINNFLENNSFIITKINYNNHFEYNNLYFNNDNLERIDNEKNRT